MSVGTLQKRDFFGNYEGGTEMQGETPGGGEGEVVYCTVLTCNFLLVFFM